MRLFMRNLLRRLLPVLLLCPALSFAAGKAEHVVVIVWDGMRPDFISQEQTPTLYQLAHDGVMFENHHSAYCSATEVNGTALATGAYPGVSGIIANRMFFPNINPNKSLDTQETEVIRKGDELSHGHYLMVPTVAEILQAAGMRTTIAGTKQVAILHDRKPHPDNWTNSVILFLGTTQPECALTTITQRFGPFPAAETNAAAPNEPRDQWTTDALTGPLWTNGVPPYSLLWLSEPDASQHAAGPGSPKALAALASSDRKLKQVLSELSRRGLREKTDLFVVSDHGFSTVEKNADVARLLQNAGFKAAREFKSPPQTGEILVVGQGGSVLFYVIGHDLDVTRKLVRFLQEQEFTGVIFTGQKLEGTFPLEQALISAPNAPDVVLSMRWSAEKSKTGAPGVFTMDSASRKVGGGSHASLSRFDVHNTLVAIGPDLKKGFSNTFPTANVDLAPTILWLLGVKVPESMSGRVLSEALTIPAPPASTPTTRRLEAKSVHEKFIWHQYLQISQVNQTIYLDEGNGSQTPK
jgi:arylsulfatase A-like enzyme